MPPLRRLALLLPLALVPAGRPEATLTAQERLVNVASFASGATIVQRPSEYGDTYTSLMLLDESPKSMWASAKGVTGNQRIVIALAERSVLKSLVFDTAGVDGAGRGAKDVVVEASDEGPLTGFQPIAKVALADKADGQRFAVSAERPARWVALVVLTNHGSAEYVELMGFRADGTQLTRTPPGHISGTYLTKWPGGSAVMHVRQEGTLVTGCYEFDQGVLTGGLDDRVLRFTWRQAKTFGPAIMVISPDGKRLNGLYWNGDRAEGQASWWDGTKTGDTPGTCSHWTPGKAVERDLRDTKRARLYGITFDFGADHIRDESKATLDQVVAALRANADWRLTIEGHTDAVGGDQANQQLSDRRAAAVKTYLTGAGVDAGRLTSRGFGSKQPVASNETELGRAQNRRVELVRE
jgi:outer membrane protein OmpA-like peptidoglycan-associated protein